VRIRPGFRVLSENPRGGRAAPPSNLVAVLSLLGLAAWMFIVYEAVEGHQSWAGLALLIILGGGSLLGLSRARFGLWIWPGR
jgi:hypothetical protein